WRHRWRSRWQTVCAGCAAWQPPVVAAEGDPPRGGPAGPPPGPKGRAQPTRVPCRQQIC
ncbi:hypothetical protein ABPG77_001503, partial [Micractinium sp. CCAP 211/92]